ncbi:MAG: hypothetical protein ABW080_17215 [Candidatus Thiodiazotropha sp.]
MIAASFKKIVDGFLYGIGFAIPVWAVYLVASEYQMANMFQENTVISDLENYGLVFEEQRIEKSSDSAFLLGSIKNPTDNKLSGVSLEAEFFNKEGVFSDKCWGKLNGVMVPNEKRHFKLKCEALLGDYEKYQLRVTYAYSSDIL